MSEGPIKSRRAARVAAFQAVYQCSQGGCSIDRAVDEALSRMVFTPARAQMVRDLAVGAVTGVVELDSRYSPFLKAGWTPERLALVDRLMLRMAVFELWSMPDVPPVATITEYVDLAKQFGSAESARFLNAVLGRVLAVSPKKDWAGEEQEQEEEQELEEELSDDPEPVWSVKSDEPHA